MGIEGRYVLWIATHYRIMKSDPIIALWITTLLSFLNSDPLFLLIATPLFIMNSDLLFQL